MASLKEMTAHIRKRIAHEGIKARVRMTPGRIGSLQVFVPEYGMQFSETDQRTIRIIASANQLTLVRGLPIDIERMTDPYTFEFYLAQ